MSLQANRILLGVTGGIAAYKSADLVRRLRDAGAEVRVVMTRGAQAFVTPLTFQAVSGQPVRTELFDPAAEAAMGHIELARWAERILVAPASADFMARLHAGMADDLLTTLCLASEAPITLAPAMNRLMWANPATQANLAGLRARGVDILGPGAGSQACGEEGEGRMLEPLEIVERLAGGAADGPLKGVSVMVTAGPTREAIDPVRYISNHSSGKMGFAVAAAAAAAGAEVTLVAGPCGQPTPGGVTRVDVTSARDMHEAVMARLAGCDIFIAAAAVADYRAAEDVDRKIKKSEENLRIPLVRNPDILQDAAGKVRFSVGFAAETHDLADYAEDKLRRKGLDMIAANWVGAGKGFDVDDNALEVFWPGGRVSLPNQDKNALARALMDIITERYHAKH